MPEVRSEADLDAATGLVADCFGIYEQMNVSKRPDRVIHAGRAILRLADGSSLMLESQDAGVRSEAEIGEFEGKRVCIRGHISRWVLAWGDGSVASIVSDAIMNIESIRLAD